MYHRHDYKKTQSPDRWLGSPIKRIHLLCLWNTSFHPTLHQVSRKYSFDCKSGQAWESTGALFLLFLYTEWRPPNCPSSPAINTLLPYTRLRKHRGDGKNYYKKTLIFGKQASCQKGGGAHQPCSDPELIPSQGGLCLWCRLEWWCRAIWAVGIRTYHQDQGRTQKKKTIGRSSVTLVPEPCRIKMGCAAPPSYISAYPKPWMIVCWCCCCCSYQIVAKTFEGRFFNLNLGRKRLKKFTPLKKMGEKKIPFPNVAQPYRTLHRSSSGRDKRRKERREVTVQSTEEEVARRLLLMMMTMMIMLMMIMKEECK